jgi:hypothetical protein
MTNNSPQVIFNPGAFIDVIKCACVDTFQSVFPQCVDCFIQTGQENVLNSPNLPAVVDGMRKVCGVASTLMGNVSAVDGESTPAPVPTGNGVSQIESRTMIALVATIGIVLGSLLI